MNKAPWIFLGVLFTLSLSWWGMVFGPSAQMANLSADKGDGSSVQPRVGLAKQGEQVYRENGCYYCHTRTATGGGFGYELRLTQLGDNREVTDEILGDSLKGQSKVIGLIDLAFEFKKVAQEHKNLQDAVAAKLANESAITKSETVVADLADKANRTETEDENLAKAREALAEAIANKASLEEAASDAAFENAKKELKQIGSERTQGMSQAEKDHHLFSAFGLSGVEFKDTKLTADLGLGVEIVESNKKIVDEASVNLTKDLSHWGDIKDLVRGLKTRAGAQFKLKMVAYNWPDVENNIARRQSVSRDFMHDAHAMPGVMRLGPDLANAGGRPALADENLFYVHLYQPRLVSEKSMMPPYRYLFRKVKLNAGDVAPDNALKHKDLEEGYAIIPTEKAEALYEFLKSLRTDALPEAPVVEKPKLADE